MSTFLNIPKTANVKRPKTLLNLRDIKKTQRTVEIMPATYEPSGTATQRVETRRCQGSSPRYQVNAT